MAKPTIAHIHGNPSFDDAANSVLSPQDFRAAYDEISQWDGYAVTPLYSLSRLASDLAVESIYYKDEGPRFGIGSFKALGGAYAALRVLSRELRRRNGEDVSLAEIRRGLRSEETRRITLVTATDGNHGRALAWGCRQFGAKCRIYIHANVSVGRERAIKELGAEVVRIDGDYDASVGRARQDAKANDWFVVSDTSWPGYTETPREVMSGYGVMVREIFEQISAPPSHVFVQGGVGGLAAAVAASLRQSWGTKSPRVIVVEPDRAPCLFESARRGQATAIEIVEETIMAGLSCGEPSPLAWDVLSSEVSDFLVISDSLVPAAMHRLARPDGDDPVIAAGESAVAGLAALMAVASSQELRQVLDLQTDSRVLLIGSEGATDPDVYDAIMGGLR